MSEREIYSGRLYGLFAIALLVPALALPVLGQQQNPRELVREAIANQVNDDPHGALFGWKTRNASDGQSKVTDEIQTPEGTVSRVLLINDKPLDPAQRAQEETRMQQELDPNTLHRKQKDKQEDDQRTYKLLSSIPDAFDFTYVDSSKAPNGHTIVRINFTARPGYNPPSRESAVFTGMQGEMLVDADAKRLVKVDGVLFKEVNFGWGILGKLYKGGRFVVEQCEVTPSHWDTSSLVLHFEGKALFFKRIHIDDAQHSWGYHPVPAMSARQALELLNRSQPPQDARVGH